MMINHLLLARTKFAKNSTRGNLYLPGKFESVKFCSTIEDASRTQKIPHQTCIPEGTYQLKVTRSPKFKRNLILVCDVPNYTGIRIHYGKNEDWSSGCILVPNLSLEKKLTTLVATWSDPTWLTIAELPNANL